MGMTCGTCRHFSALRDGGLVGTCSAGPCKRGGSAPCVTASMDAEECPDYSQIDRRLVAAMERSKDMAGSLDRLSDALFEQLDRLGGLDLADTERVDAEHERQMADAFETRNSDENLEADGWMRLPKDADGEPIHVGDKVVEVDEPAVPRTVTSINLVEDGWWVYINGVGRRSDKYRHVKQPTVEDVLRQFLGECESAANLGYDEVPQEVFDDYASKLQLRGDAE